jgi:GNAT superfamily N-acetyltransferase
MNAKLRQATEADLAALTEIAHQAKRHWGYPETLIATWSPGLTLDERSLVDMHLAVADVSGTPEGFCAIVPGRPQFQLEHLWVHPRSMGHGLGRRLFEYAVGFARSQGAETLGIESDPNAEPFYVRMGAVRVGSIAAPVDGNADRILPLLEYPLQDAQEPVSPKRAG